MTMPSEPHSYHCIKLHPMLTMLIARSLSVPFRSRMPVLGWAKLAHPTTLWRSYLKGKRDETVQHTVQQARSTSFAQAPKLDQNMLYAETV